MYAAQCYQACLDGVCAIIQKEEDIKEILSENIKGEERIMDIIVTRMNLWGDSEKTSDVRKNQPGSSRYN